MKTNRKLFLSGFSEETPLIMHVTSRIVDRQFLLGDEEREVFVEMMRMYEEFCGIKVLSYCVMSNHFHILMEIPPQMDVVELSDEEFLAKLSCIYSANYVKEVKKWMQKLNKNQAPKAMRELKAKYTYRMGNMSEFMKSLKQRFSRWYNKKHGRRGTLWEERYSSTAVSSGSAARMVAAYIDLNPLRAGMLGACTSSQSSAGDPKDYRWCSYGESVAGGKKAIAGYLHLYQGAGAENVVGARKEEGLTADDVMQRYRMLMAEEGEEADQEALPMMQGQNASKKFKKRRGYSREEIDAILEKNGKLTRAEMLRCKTRYFTDGAVIGSKAFVNGFFKRMKEGLTGAGEVPERKIGGKPMRRLDHTNSDTLYSYRDLQKDVYGEG